MNIKYYYGAQETIYNLNLKNTMIRQEKTDNINNGVERILNRLKI